jgi:hypothetical protein
MCLILTLLAVPVFYSLFDDAADTPFFRGIGDGLGKVKSKIMRPVVNRFSSTLRTTGDVRDEDGDGRDHDAAV